MPVRQLWFESRFEYNQTSFDVTINQPQALTLGSGYFWFLGLLLGDVTVGG